MSVIVDGSIALLLVALALWTVSARDVFVAIVGFICYGLLLGLVWVRLSGIDVALTEAAIGGGLTGALLIGAAARLRATEAASRSERCGAPTRVIALVLSVSVSAALIVAVFALPNPAPTLAHEVAADIAATDVLKDRKSVV